MRLSILTLFGCLLSAQIYAQSFWQFVPEKNLNISEQAVRQFVPSQLLTLNLDYPGVFLVLKQAPMENTSGTPLTLELPTAEGHSRLFQVWESPVTAPELLVKFPDTRTYSGHSADGYQVRLGTGPRGFYAFMLAPDGSVQTIRPYAVGEMKAYMVYYSRDVKGPDPASDAAFRCGVETHPEHTDGLEANFLPKVTDRSDAPVKLKKYRIAIAAMGEYSTFHGGTKPLVHNAIVEALAYINLIFERDLTVHLDLIPNNDAIIFLNEATDPYTGDQTLGFMDQNPAAINPIVGIDSYDIGHVFGVYFPGNKATGIANRSGTCTNPNKGKGCSTAPNPVGEYFYKVAAHEMCHQLSGTHTWNNCSEDFVDQRSLVTVFEPGSGSTLMAYAGGCTVVNNVVADNDPYFHLANILQVREFVTTGVGSTCGTETDTDNNPPTAQIPLNDGFFIPISTPFKLTGEGSDSDGDQLRYCFEQWDRDTIGLPVDLGAAAAEGALFRSYTPSLNATRIFPTLSRILANQNEKSEVLPNVNRPLTFRLSVRDYHAGGGAVAWDEVQFRATNQAGPFKVITPNSQTDVWLTGEYQTVVWDVANTDRAPVNCKKVNIRLSTDGQTFPILLAAGVPNNGRACVKVPNQVTNFGRVWIEAADNIFFDISNSGFKIQNPTQPAFSLCAGSLVDTVCLPATYTATINSVALQGFSSPIDLSASTNLAGAVVKLNTNALTPGSDAILTIEFPAGNPDGDFTIVVGGSSAGLNDSVVISLHVVSNNFSALAPVSPVDGAVGQDQAPVLRWVKVPDANLYDIQVATNPSFGANTLVAFLSGTPLDSFKIPVLQPKGQILYWRIRPKNECGTADWFGPYAFAIVVDVCQTFESTDVPKNISANGTPTVESKITIPAGGIISDVNVTKIQGNHAFMKDMEVRLISPAGTNVLLFKDKCPGTFNFNLGLDDSKTGLFGCPPPTNGSTSKPTEALSAINGQNSGGDWILRIKDNVIGSGGQLTGFALELCSSASLNPPVLVNNNPMQVEPGKNKAVTTDLLKTTDANNTDNQLLYTLTTIPKYGELQLNLGGKMSPGAQFTQTDLNNGALRYFDYGFSGKQDQFCFTVTDGEGGLISDCFTIQPFPLVDTKEPNPSIAFLLAPNPATDLVRIAFDQPLTSETRVRFFDASGRLVRDLTLATGQLSAEVNVSGLPEGLYAVAVENALSTGVRKVVVR